MNIDDVLLTPSEIANLMFAENGSPTLRFEDACRSQCLKLLEWLNGYCDNDDHPGYYSESQRCECGECMYELESKLKEG
jgi:hypothetical protein